MQRKVILIMEERYLCWLIGATQFVLWGVGWEGGQTHRDQ